MGVLRWRGELDFQVERLSKRKVTTLDAEVLTILRMGAYQNRFMETALKESDRRLATEIVMGVLRWRGELDFQVERLSKRKVTTLDSEVLTILRIDRKSGV